jgi:hypothetical protein
MIYLIKFNGRRKGAIGVFEDFEVQVEANSKKQALNKLYENYEHIHNPVVLEESVS